MANSKLKSPLVEVVKKPEKQGYDYPTCHNCWRPIATWNFGVIKCPHCGATLKIKRRK